MKVTVRCFASVRELLGEPTVELSTQPSTVRDLRQLLAERAPDLLRLRMAYAVNQEWADETTLLAEGDEVALIPPISGGAGKELFRFDLVHGPLDPRVYEAEVRSDADGAVVTFAGVTREVNDGRKVRALAYEAYEEMAQKLVMRLFEEAVKRFAIGRARVAHRLGAVDVGETSVLVVVASPHRAPAFDACRFLMDRVKAEVPIFKKELLDDGRGGSRWVGDLPAT